MPWVKNKKVPTENRECIIDITENKRHTYTNPIKYLGDIRTNKHNLLQKVALVLSTCIYTPRLKPISVANKTSLLLRQLEHINPHL